MKRKFFSYIFLGAIILAFFVAVFGLSLPVKYSSSDSSTTLSTGQTVPKIIHISTPEPLKAIYMTSCVASLRDWRNKIADLIDVTELNSVVVDIKDYTGTVSFGDLGPKGEGCRVSDMLEFIQDLHDRGIYVIGRVAVFQDPLYAKLHPELAVKRKSDGGVWKDRKGLSFIDVGAKEYWNYIVEISKESEKIGFDEINFDYIRFPSDGNMNDIAFTHTGSTTKPLMLKQFFQHLDKSLEGVEIKTSVDLFGMVTTNSDDLRIGQVLENALPYFDYLSPMVYPSHSPAHFNGWPDPNKVPYELIKYVMQSAVTKTELLASTTQNFNIKKEQLRPWLQDNDYPIPYTAEMVRAQIQGTYDAGLTSWMLWDPANKYTEAALLKN